MKKPISLILALLLCLTLCPVAARAEGETSEPQTFNSEGYYCTLLADGTAEITWYYGRESNLCIPDVLDGIPVTRIGDKTFSGCFNLATVMIPDSIISIGTHPFSFCENLTSFSVSPDHPTLAVIDNVLFEKINKKLVCYPMGKTADRYAIPQGIQWIGEQAFYGCVNLTSITIPDSVSIIDNYAFSVCRSLDGIIIPDSVKTIGNFAFWCCHSLTNITVPDSVTAIGNYAFRECENLTNIIIPDSITAIGEDAFMGCDSLTATVGRGSYAAKYCKENNIPYTYPDSNDWLNP